MSSKEINLDDLQNGFNKGGITITNQAKDISSKNIKTYLSTFKRVGIKKATFENSSFTQCIFEEVYGRKAQFTNVDFTGTTFINCNFEKAQFSSCIFKYCTFKNTELPVQEIINCLPPEHNLRNDLSRNLKVNFSTLGRKKESDIFLEKEIESYQDELWAIFRSQTQYYKSIYDVMDRLEHLFKYGWSKFIGFLYGHGFKIQKLVYSYIILIIFLSFLSWGIGYQYVEIYSLSPTEPKSLSLFQSIFLVFGEAVKYSFIEVRPVETGGKLILIIIRFLGLLYLGLLSATIYRRISR